MPWSLRFQRDSYTLFGDSWTWPIRECRRGRFHPRQPQFDECGQRVATFPRGLQTGTTPMTTFRMCHSELNPDSTGLAEFG